MSKSDSTSVEANNTSTDSSSSIEPKTEIAMDVFHSKPKFLIYMILSIYNELSLTQLSKMLKKRKSTISVHLKKMLEANLVEISKRVKVRGDKKAKYYRLVEDIDEKITLFSAKDEEKMTPAERMSFQLRAHALFAQMNISFQEKWLEFLNDTLQDIEEGKFEALQEELHLFEQEFVKFSVFSSYSIPVTKGITKTVYELFAEAEEKSKEDKQGKEEYIRPEFVTFSVLPIKKVFDYYMSKEE